MKKQTHLDKIIDKYKLVLISQHCSDKYNIYKTEDPNIYVRDYTPSIKGRYIDTKKTETLIFFYSHNQKAAELYVTYTFLLDANITAWEYIVNVLNQQISELK